MDIKNATSGTVSWFCYNKQDAVRIVALASGDLKKGDSKEYKPPVNATGFYAVRFTKQGGGTELAVGAVSRTGSIELIEDDGSYTTQPIPAETPAA